MMPLCLLKNCRKKDKHLRLLVTMRVTKVFACALTIFVLSYKCTGDIIPDIRNDFLAPERALEMASLARIVYKITNSSVDFNTIIPEEHYQTIAWIDKGGTEVLVLVKVSTPGDSSSNDADYWSNKTLFVPHGEIIVSFRGTEETEDWVANFEYNQVPYGSPDYFNFSHPMYQPSDTGGVEELSVTIHQGFSKVFEAYNDILDVLEPLMNNRTNLFITGHSLGGANAVLFASYYAFTHPFESTYVTTHGAPRCGNRGFKLFTEQLRNLNIWRVVNKLDVVTRVPYDGYDHVGHLLWKQEDGKVRAFYNQIGSINRGYKGIRDFSIALMRVDMVDVLLDDHRNGAYIEWLEAAVLNPETNFTDDFEKYA